MSCSVRGCPGGPTVIAANQANPFAIAVDATGVYWTNAGDASLPSNGTVNRCAVGGCPQGPVLLATHQSVPIQIALDATYVVWLNSEDGDTGDPGEIMRAVK
jgi:hypothetical protein